METVSKREANILAKRLKGVETTEEAIADMMRTSKGIEELEEQPVLEVEIHAETEGVVPYLSTYHYLTTFLELTERALNIEQEFDRFMDRNPDLYTLQAMEEFTGGAAENTYNYDTVLDAVLQYVTFDAEHRNGSVDIYERDAILLQVHGGGDVRGGYSSPRVFEFAQDIDYFYIKQRDLDAACTGCDVYWYSDDCGYHWYEGPDFIFEETDDDGYGSDRVLCGKCGSKVDFNVILNV